MIIATYWRFAIWIAFTILILFCGARSFAQSFDSALLNRARVASEMIPGDRPLEVRFQGFSEWSAPQSQYVEDATDKAVAWVAGVFQIRFQDGWIMVDAGAEETHAGSTGFSDADYKEYERALEQASLTVITHEHADHTLSLVRGKSAEMAAKRALLTVEQRDSMLNAETDWPVARISAEQAEKFLVAGYEELLPIAPGVVLIKAPGHTKGSQILFVSLATGMELLLVGDVIWHKSQIANASQKSSSWDYLGEDKQALKTQVEWLKDVSESETHVVIAHDLSAIEAQLSDGVLIDGLYLPSQ
jgi:glyoxylase-like metal-dependent hydrolase (beta-lactamase superfamily II)